MNHCDCPQKAHEALAKHHNSPVELNLRMWVCTSTGETGMDFPPLEYWYMKGKKRVKTHIAWNYCPMCGKSKRNGEAKKA